VDTTGNTARLARQVSDVMHRNPPPAPPDAPAVPPSLPAPQTRRLAAPLRWSSRAGPVPLQSSAPESMRQGNLRLSPAQMT
jgi:hypothetical protein